MSQDWLVMEVQGWQDHVEAVSIDYEPSGSVRYASLRESLESGGGKDCE